MKCDRIQESLPAYLSGETTDLEDRGITAHLDDCPDCRQVYAELRQAWKLMDAWQEEIPSTFAAARFRKTLRQFIAQTEAEPEPAFERAIRRWSFWSRGWQALSIPAFATAITVAFFWAIGLDVSSSLENLRQGPFRSPSYVVSSANAADPAPKAVEKAPRPEQAVQTLFQQAHPAEGGFTVVNFESPLKTASSQKRYETSADGDYY